MKTYSQEGQDKFIYETFFKGQQYGFFVDCGANDGITYSNTKLFEELGWNGICIEPIPSAFEKLKQNRSCYCIEAAVGKESEYEFNCIEGYAEMLSGIVDKYDPKHLERIDREIKTYGGSRKTIKVKGFDFNKIDVTQINYLSIDVEGGESEIIDSIDFNKFKIKVISLENNYGIKYNLPKHKYYGKCGGDEIYVLK